MKIPICLVNGPNLNLLGTREPQIYGQSTLKDILQSLSKNYPEFEFRHFQSNHEGEILDFIQKEAPSCEYGIINGGALTHTSVALRDVISAFPCKFVEVHISNIYQREDFRKHSYLSGVCDGLITGFGIYGYQMAAAAIRQKIAQ